MKGIRVTVEDLETGEKSEQVIENDYVLVTAGTCYLHATSVFQNGTHVITVKGRTSSVSTSGEGSRQEVPS